MSMLGTHNVQNGNSSHSVVTAFAHTVWAIQHFQSMELIKVEVRKRWIYYQEIIFQVIVNE